MATRSQERKPASCVPRKTEEDQSRRARYGNFSKAPKICRESFISIHGENGCARSYCGAGIRTSRTGIVPAQEATHIAFVTHSRLNCYLLGFQLSGFQFCSGTRVRG